ncbi:MAG: L,D-transpeptidase [Bauldia sp.]|nr:L,D-transpeptidase [Bauldia sp.]
MSAPLRLRSEPYPRPEAFKQRGSLSATTLFRHGATLAVIGLALAGCMSSQRFAFEQGPQALASNLDATQMYAPVQDGLFLIPAVDVSRLDPQYYRQVVSLPPHVPDVPGTIVVDPDNRFLYLVGEGGEAIRYGIGVGREGFSWSGMATVARKVEWPTWTPPKEMVYRDPKAAPFADGMPGGLDNPLGARAMYLFQGKHDTLYRIHGTNEPSSIGVAVSSGCIRLLNQDIIDLYLRAPEGTEVVVLPSLVPSV